ncbi:MAG: acyclic terpene utilization AtuA family protein [Pseudomonadota bacterium]
MAERVVRIGGASGYWGESDMAVPQFLSEGGLDYVVFDYLAEITMSIMARARAKNPEFGYATDFVSAVMKPNLQEIARQGVKIVSNAGGVNPIACGKAIETLVAEQGLDLKVAVITGDDLLDRAEDLAGQAYAEMFSSEPFPDSEKLASINAYLGAFPIAEALTRGADIVITGRSVDSAVTLGACIHEFGWTRDDLDLLASGSLAGHILECGPQATGGNYTDWEDVADSLHEVGYPIAEICADGSFVCTKPDQTGGAVTVGTVGEQMLYEIGDPAAYALPDVICDFSHVEFNQLGADRVQVTGARGVAVPDTYKVSATYQDGWRAGTVMFFYGEDASDKARAFADSVLLRARGKLRAVNAPDFTETLIELIGDESIYGAHGASDPSRSVAVKIAAKHEDQRAVGMLLKEISGHGLAAPPGLSGFSGGRSRPSPVLRLFSFLIPKEELPLAIVSGGETVALPEEVSGATSAKPVDPAIVPELPDHDAQDLLTVPLIKLAYARSGDKGDKANVGVLPRDKSYAPWIWATLTEPEIEARFEHYLDGEVQRFYMPGTGAMNILMDKVLGGGGVASLRNDPQGKGYSQILLQTPIKIPRALAEVL